MRETCCVVCELVLVVWLMKVRLLLVVKRTKRLLMEEGRAR